MVSNLTALAAEGEVFNDEHKWLPCYLSLVNCHAALPLEQKGGLNRTSTGTCSARNRE